MQAGAIGDDIDFHVLVHDAIMFDHIGSVVQRKVHDLRIVLVDLDGNAMRLAVGSGTCRNERHRYEGDSCNTMKKAEHHNTP